MQGKENCFSVPVKWDPWGSVCDWVSMSVSQWGRGRLIEMLTLYDKTPSPRRERETSETFRPVRYSWQTDQQRTDDGQTGSKGSFVWLPTRPIDAHHASEGQISTDIQERGKRVVIEMLHFYYNRAKIEPSQTGAGTGIILGGALFLLRIDPKIAISSKNLQQQKQVRERRPCTSLHPPLNSNEVCYRSAPHRLTYNRTEIEPTQLKWRGAWKRIGGEPKGNTTNPLSHE